VKVLNIAVWSLGLHAINRIIPELLLMKSIKLVGICSRNKDTINQYTKKIGCIGWTNPSEMLSSNIVDIIFIASPIGLHAEHAKLALQSGKHVWCEKPLTCKYSDTVSLINTAKKKALIITECFMFLHHPQFKYIQSFVNDNNKNGIKSLVCRFGMPFLDKPGFRNNPDMCGGAFWDLGSHTVAAVTALFPNQDFKVLFSEINNMPNTNIDFEGRAILKFSKGASAYLEWGFGTSYKNDIDIWANDNSIFTDKFFSKPLKFQPKFYIRNKNGNMRIVNGKISEQFRDMFLSFHDSYNSLEKINIEYTNIIRRSKIMDEIIEASKIN